VEVIGEFWWAELTAGSVAEGGEQKAAWVGGRFPSGPMVAPEPPPEVLFCRCKGVWP